ncbi:MAG: hypothetical protein ACTHMP_07985 [Thermomicrobiales bacterium]
MVATEDQSTRKTMAAMLPIVAVSGRWGKTTTARLLEAMVRAERPRLALWLDQGVWVNGRRQPGELVPWGQPIRALAHGELDLAIQELDAPMVNAVGLPPATYGLAIITSFCGNDEVCLADPRSAIEHRAQLAVARAVHPEGALVLNADDHAVVDEGGVTIGERLYYGSSRRNPIIRAQLANGGRAVTSSDGMIALREGRRSQPVAAVREVAISLGGAIVFQVQNALAAVAAAWQLGVPADRIAAALRDFTSTPTLLPGACNQFTIAGATVVVDRLHDAYSARLLMRGLRRVRGRRRRLVVLPESLPIAPASALEIGRLMGHSFDLVITHERAGDDPAVIEALRAGIALNPVPPMVLAMPDEAAALDRALQLVNRNDLALVLAADLSFVLRTLLTHRLPDLVGTPGE